MSGLNSDEEQSDYQTPVICEDCEGNRDVRYFCLECKVNICEKCKGRRLHRKHRVLPRGHREVRNARKAAHSPCKEHPDKAYVTFCRKCKVPCCPDCISEKHNEHSFCSIEEVANEAREEIQTRQTDLEISIIPLYQQRDADISNGILQYKMSIEIARERLTKRIKLLQQELNSAEEEFKKQFNETERVDLHKMEAIRKANEDQSNDAKSLVAACQSALTESSYIELLKLREEIAHTPVSKPRPDVLPPLVHFDPSSNSKFSKELFGQIHKGNSRTLGVDLSKASTDGTKGKDRSGTSSVEGALTIRTVDNIVVFRLLHNNNNQMWGYDNNALTLYDIESMKMQTFELEFILNDMALLPSQEIIATDNSGRLVKISYNGSITRFTTLWKSEKLIPFGICINDRQQIVVGLTESGWLTSTIITLAIYSSDGNLVMQDLGKERASKPLFRNGINQVKQNRNGDYVVSDIDRVVCVSREGTLRWDYKVGEYEGGRIDIQGIVIDQHEHIIVAECNKNKITVLDRDGQLVMTLLTEEDGIRRPCSMSIDNDGVLYIGQLYGQVKVVKYRT